MNNRTCVHSMYHTAFNFIVRCFKLKILHWNAVLLVLHYSNYLIYTLLVLSAQYLFIYIFLFCQHNFVWPTIENYLSFIVQKILHPDMNKATKS